MTKYDIHADITNKIIEALEANINHGDWKMPWARVQGAALPRNGVTGATYRGINVLLLGMSGYASNEFASFRQWQSKGYSVLKGETGTKIVFFKSYKIEDKDTGEEKNIPVPRSYTVFAREQTNAPQLEAPELPNEAEHIAQVEQYISNTQAAIYWNDRRAFYRPSTDSIHMPAREAFHTTEGLYGTLLHELIHWTGADNRCKREFGVTMRDTKYAKEELVAELGATFLCASLGVENSIREDHIQYIKSWLDVLKGDKKFIFKAAAAAQKAVDFLDELQPAE